MTRKWFLMMRNMFLGSEMMFDMIRNYFGVESDDFIFRPLRGRFDDSLPMGTPLGARNRKMIVMTPPPGGGVMI